MVSNYYLKCWIILFKQEKYSIIEKISKGEMMMNKTKGSTILKIIGALMIAFGLYSLFAGFTFVNATEASLQEVLNTNDAIDVNAIHTIGYVTLGLGAFMTIAGLAGFIFGNKKEKANIIIGFGAVYLLFAVISIFMQMNAGMKLEVNTFTPLILPLVYLYCGFMNKKA